MKNMKKLNSILLRKNSESWSMDLKKILDSDNIQLGNPYNEKSNYLLTKYKKRMGLYNENDGHNHIFGLIDLVKKLSLLSGDENLEVYPMQNDLFIGECILKENEMIGCAFIKRGRSYSKNGLWIEGNKIC